MNICRIGARETSWDARQAPLVHVASGLYFDALVDFLRHGLTFFYISSALEICSADFQFQSWTNADIIFVATMAIRPRSD